MFFIWVIEAGNETKQMENDSAEKNWYKTEL